MATRRTRRPDGMPGGATWWDAPDGGLWLVTVTEWAQVDGRAEPVGVELRSARRSEDPRPEHAWERGHLPPNSAHDPDPIRRRPLAVTSSVWHKVPLGALLREIRKRHAQGLEELAPMPGHGSLRAWRAPRRRGGVVTQQAVLEVYLAARKASEHPTKAVMDTFNLSKSAAANRVRRLRAEGLLPPATKGRASGGADERGVS